MSIDSTKRMFVLYTLKNNNLEVTMLQHSMFSQESVNNPLLVQLSIVYFDIDNHLCV